MDEDERTREEWDAVSWADAAEPETAEAGEEAAPAEAAESAPETAQSAGEAETQETAPEAGREPPEALNQAQDAERDGLRRERDGLRRERDALAARDRENRELLEELAKGTGTTAEELVLRARARRLVRSEAEQGRSLSEEEAVERLRQEAAQSREREQAPAEPAGAADREESFRRFAEAFPEVKAQDIPQEVWNGVKAGGELTALYTAWENRQLKERIRALEQNEKNAARSTGSRQSAGAQTGRNTIEELWDKYD